ncbi:hypothetical protein EV646_102641 [Kribbella antiqua]|uniref:Uncharacterized protein n=1 Tax=Kribbella antiqua TaxID=2512217 RepID=A0A4R2IZ38_9ACTN|nr:hypothetical protein EV646_102641 [Kribbella antiqua]
MEAYSLTPVGDLAAYAVIEPATLSLYPDAEGTASVTITVPQEAVVQAGDVPFGVLVEPKEHPADTAVPEALVHVQPFSDLTAELTPRTSHGSRIGRHTLAIDNRGNQPVTVELTGKDPDAVVEFCFSPSTIEVAPGTASFAKVKARPLDRIWRGPSKTRQFSIAVTQVKGFTVTTVDGMMVQDPILPPWTGKAVAGVLAACALLVGLWFGVLRPAVESSAQNAVEKPLQAIAQKAEEAKTTAGQAQETAKTAQTQANNTGKAQNNQAQEQNEREKAVAAQAAAAIGQPFSRRWPLTAKPGQSDQASYTVPDGMILRITDVNFESQGSTGWLDLRRDKDSLGGVAPQYFRNIQDYRYISPLAVLTAGQKVVAHLDCTAPAPGATTCQNAIMVGGNLVTAPKPTTTPKPN